MVEDQDPWRAKAVNFHEDLAEALGVVVDYQQSLNTLGAADPHRNRTNPLMQKYGVEIVPNRHNAWRGPNGVL